jgi:zinc protease
MPSLSPSPQSSSPLSDLPLPLVRSFPSGLTIVAEQIPVPAISFDLWIRVGSAVEPDEINGVAHFLEHMIFKGTENLPPGAFDRRVEAVGANLNAATSQDYTHYYFTSAPQDFADLVPLQLEVVTQPKLPPQEFDQERRVVLEEILRAQDQPERRIAQRKLEAVFSELPYRRPVLGPAAVIEQLELTQMRSFHDQWYQPPHITLAIVGSEPAEAMVETVLQHLPPSFLETTPTLQPHPTLCPEPRLSQPIREHYQDDQLEQDRLVMAWRVPGLQDLADTYALDVLASLLSHGRTSRLVRRLREEQQWVRQISAYNSNYQVQGIFGITAKLLSSGSTSPTAKDDRQRVEAAIWEEIEKIQQGDIREAELNRVRTQVANRFIFANERPQSRAQLYGYYQALLGDVAPGLQYPKTIAQVTAEAVQKAAQTYLTPEQTITLSFANTPDW